MVTNSLKNVDKTLLEEIGIINLLTETITDFDLYLDIGGHLVLYAPAPYFWNQNELGRLSYDGYSGLFYHIKDKEKVDAYSKISNIDFNSFKNAKNNSEKLNLVCEASSELTKAIFEISIDENVIHHGEKLAIEMVDSLINDLYCVNALTQLKTHDNYTFSHSSRVAAYSVALAINLSLKDKKALKDIAMGALFHDIGKSKIDVDLLNKKEKLTSKEWEKIKQHPKIGHMMISGSNLAGVSKDIILHHHERNDGKGYPHGLSSADISGEVQIVSFADIFDALTSERCYQKAMTKFDAMNFIKKHLLDQIGAENYHSMIEIIKSRD